VDATVAERDRMIATLREAGWPVPDSQANFVWLPTVDALDVAGRLEQQGLTVRAFPDEGIRITVGPAEANDRVLDVLT
jgi:histidinol-phosphate aminotransferase